MKEVRRYPKRTITSEVLIGEWAIEWSDHLDDAVPRCVKGEWIFSRILEGTAIQDLFIVPSRTERLSNPQADAEYGTTCGFIIPRQWRGIYSTDARAVHFV